MIVVVINVVIPTRDQKKKTARKVSYQWVPSQTEDWRKREKERKGFS